MAPVVAVAGVDKTMEEVEVEGEVTAEDAGLPLREEEIEVAFVAAEVEAAAEVATVEVT